MPRYALRLEYDGAGFAGWQRQSDQPSVQGALESALARLEPDLPPVVAAGRTDAGVHALGQVVHCDMACDWGPFRLGAALNHHLKPHAVAVIAVARVGNGWHARFSAIERRYLYRLVSRRAPLVLGRGQLWRVGHMLDAAAMQRAVRHLIGLHDFTTFRASLCQAKSPLKTLDTLCIRTRDHPGGTEFRFSLSARSFLHTQVRSIVGTLERVGAGAWPPARVARALAARDRAACGPVAPPDGLYLAGVGYAEDPFAAQDASGGSRYDAAVFGTFQ